MSAWRDRLAALTVREAVECPDEGLTKPPKAPYGSFGSARDEYSALKNCVPGKRLATIGRMRGELQRIARLEGIDLAHVERMDDADVLAYAQVPDFTERNYRAHLRALAASADMDAGKVPAIWRGAQAAICNGCGPVLLELGAPDWVGNCPWCFRRKAGKVIPKPMGER